MGEISITSEKEAFTNISNNFIKYYMADANGDFVKLYIYLAMLCSTKSQISVSDIADHLSCTENDICRGIRYWIKADVLSLSYNTDKEVTGILLKDLKKMDVELSDLKIVDSKLSLGSDEEKAKSSKKASNYKEEEIQDEEESQKKAPKKKQPTPDNLKVFQKDSEIANLISEATAYCNRDLGPKELNSLIYIKDQLGFSFDLCEYLLEYCAAVKKTSFSYIEKVARDWYEKDITNREDAEEYSARYITLYGRILKSLGIKERLSPTPVEKQIIDKWKDEYGFSTEIIIEACNTAILKKPNNATLNYVNGILNNWHEKGVKSFSDIVSEKEEYKKTMRDTTPIKSQSDDSSKKKKGNRLKDLEKYYLEKVEA
ncbi:MAG: DnaD domain protein [Eubacterium sp.]|nr:DnaD domain protein [Eubacterium sp.]